MRNEQPLVTFAYKLENREILKSNDITALIHLVYVLPVNRSSTTHITLTKELNTV